jgi:hypothetical protein
MNIKDREVHAMARELEPSGHESEEQAIRLRKQRVQELLDRFGRLSWPEGVTSKELQDALYDERGLPV